MSCGAAIEPYLRIRCAKPLELSLACRPDHNQVD
jgi:hypothetical protein